MTFQGRCKNYQGRCKTISGEVRTPLKIRPWFKTWVFTILDQCLIIIFLFGLLLDRERMWSFQRWGKKCGVGCANHPYLQLRAKLNYEGRSSTWYSRRLTIRAPMAATLWIMSGHGAHAATVEGSVMELIPTHPVNIPFGRKPEYPEKTHDFRQSVDWLFSHNCH
jgi:hypothetical protein